MMGCEPARNHPTAYSPSTCARTAASFRGSRANQPSTLKLFAQIGERGYPPPRGHVVRVGGSLGAHLALAHEFIVVLFGTGALGEHREAAGGGVVSVGAVRVQRVKDVGGVATVHEGDEEGPAGVGLGPSGAVVPIAVDAEAEALLALVLRGGGVGVGLLEGGSRERAQEGGPRAGHVAARDAWDVARVADAEAREGGTVVGVRVGSGDGRGAADLHRAARGDARAPQGPRGRRRRTSLSRFRGEECLDRGDDTSDRARRRLSRERRFWGTACRSIFGVDSTRTCDRRSSFALRGLTAPSALPPRLRKQSCTGTRRHPLSKREGGSATSSPLPIYHYFQTHHTLKIRATRKIFWRRSFA